MRKILFRAKRVDNKEWIEGSYIESVIAASPFGYITPSYPTEPTQIYTVTLGEFTGIYDKNGNKIFEGDIVKCQERFDRPYSKNRKSKRHIGVVEYRIRKGDRFYNPETNEWDRHMEYGAEWIVKVEDYGKFVHGSWGDFFDCEVIGNVHDNPELLESN